MEGKQSVLLFMHSFPSQLRLERRKERGQRALIGREIQPEIKKGTGRKCGAKEERKRKGGGSGGGSRINSPQTDMRITAVR